MPISKSKYKTPPLTSERQADEIVKKRNELNRQRSKRMERRIAGTLRGRRVPMSGAHSQYKGDVEIPFYNHPGKYIIECKLSAAKHPKTNESQIRLSFAWFTKLQNEAKNMGAKFGVLITNFLGHTNDYVFVKRTIIDLLITRYRSPYADILTNLISLVPLKDVRYGSGDKMRAGFTIKRNEIENAMIEVSGMKGIRLLLPDAEYLVMHLEMFKLVVEHL